jgi:hypothetical protein
MDVESEMSVADILVGLIVAFGVVIGGYLIVRRSPEQRILMAALFAKLLSCFALCAMTFPVFRGGDMLGYHRNGIRFAQLLEEDLSNGTTSYFEKTPFFLLNASNTERTESFSGLVHFMTFHSYVASSVIFAFIGFLGQLHLYRMFAAAYPSPCQLRWWRAGILFMPSVTFWSAGLLKDPLGFWALGCSMTGLYSLFTLNRLSGLVRVVVGLYAILLFRAQVAPVIVLAALPLLISNWFSRRGTPASSAVRHFGAAFRVAVFVFYLFAAYYTYSSDKRVSSGNLNRALLTQRENYRGIDAGSTVLEEVQVKGAGAGAGADSSTFGLIAFWPESMVFCLYRPFLWEGFRSPVILLASLENTVLLLLSLRAVWRAFTYPRVLAASMRSSLFLFCLLFVLLFAFAVGLTTPNLGTVSRYRIPVIPFFIGALAIFEYRFSERNSGRISAVVAPYQQIPMTPDPNAWPHPGPGGAWPAPARLVRSPHDEGRSTRGVG